MNKRNSNILACCALVTFCTCCSSEPANELPGTDGNVAVVEIHTEILTRATVTKQFANGDEMNVFAKTYNKVDAPDLIGDIKAAYNSNQWRTNPPIELKEGEHTFIYAFAPYRKGLTNLAEIPIDIAEQEDILYSGSSVPVSYTTHSAQLIMKHALALLTFNICKQGYKGNGELQSLSVSGEEVYTSGSIHLETGKIKKSSKEKFVMDIKKTIVDGWSEELPRMWYIPFSTKGSVAALTAVIDGRTYQTNFPEVEMKGGFQYIFRLILTDYGLEFIPDQTETISLNKDTDTMKQTAGYGVLRLTYSGMELLLPGLTGDNVFGTVAWGDGNSESYAVGRMHDYSSKTSKQVVIESWNSTGFELKNLEGIDEIDISEY